MQRNKSLKNLLKASNYTEAFEPDEWRVLVDILNPLNGFYTLYGLDTIDGKKDPLSVTSASLDMTGLLWL